MTGMDDKEKLTEYGYAPEIFKQFLEHIFGEGYLISVDDGQGGKDAIVISGDLDGIASYNISLHENDAILTLHFSYGYAERREFDCELNKLSKEIDDWVDEYLEDFPDNSIYETLDDEELNTIDCNIILEFESLFANAPENLMVNVHEINDKIKEILEKHER